MKLGRAIKVARARKGWNQIDLANKLEVSATYISLLERDKRDPSWSLVNRVADALEVPLPVLLLLAQSSEKTKGERLAVKSILANELLSLALTQEATAGD